MFRVAKYALRPTPAQERHLATWLALGQEFYNAALEHRRDAWRRQRESISLYDQCAQLPELRIARADLDAVPIVVLRGWLRRLDKAMRAFFRRAKQGVAPGFPRFKSRGRFSSIDIDDLSAGAGRIGDRRVQMPFLGKVRFKQHRPLPGIPKALRIKREGRRWYIAFMCADVPTKPRPVTGRSVGIDVGLRNAVATSDGELIASVDSATAQRAVIVAQRRVSRRRLGSRRRQRAIEVLRKKHARVANIRREHAIRIARFLVARYDTIYRENLNVKGLARGMLARSVNNAAWGIHNHWLDVKAEEAGRSVVAVDPRGTSQTCSECGAEVRKGLSVRVHRCPHCGYVADRDVNAARVILGRGLRLRREEPDVARPSMTREVLLLRQNPKSQGKNWADSNVRTEPGEAAAEAANPA